MNDIDPPAGMLLENVTIQSYWMLILLASYFLPTTETNFVVPGV